MSRLSETEISRIRFSLKTRCRKFFSSLQIQATSVHCSSRLLVRSSFSAFICKDFSRCRCSSKPVSAGPVQGLLFNPAIHRDSSSTFGSSVNFVKCCCTCWKPTSSTCFPLMRTPDSSSQFLEAYLVAKASRKLRDWSIGRDSRINEAVAGPLD